MHEKLYEKDSGSTENELDKINDWAKKLGYGKILDKQKGNNAVMGMYKDPILNIDVAIVDGGHGGNVFLPIIFEGYSFIDGILLIEEPEISLHPGAQGDVLDFFIEMVGQRNHQIIFTSHSEYFLKKIIRYYRNKRINEELIDIIVTFKESEGITIKRMRLDELAESFKGKKEILPELTKR